MQEKTIKKLDQIIDRVLAIGLKKLLIWDVVIYFLELIYCGIDITEYKINAFKLAFLALGCYFPILQSKTNILTGANETLIGKWWWLKYSDLTVIGIPGCILGIFGLIMLLFTRDIQYAILNFMAPPLLYTTCKAVYLYNEREKEPPLWNWED